MTSSNGGRRLKNCEVNYNWVSPQQNAPECQIAFYLASAIYVVRAMVLQDRSCEGGNWHNATGQHAYFRHLCSSKSAPITIQLWCDWTITERLKKRLDDVFRECARSIDIDTIHDRFCDYVRRGWINYARCACDPRFVITGEIGWIVVLCLHFGKFRYLFDLLEKGADVYGRSNIFFFFCICNLCV
jgi:hypothetical protein